MCLFSLTLVLKTVKGTGRLQNNLYKLYIPTSNKVSLYSAQLFDVQLWHSRLEHVLMKILSSIPVLSSIKDCTSFACDICPQARQVRHSFPLSSTILLNKFELIHLDVWRPYKHVTHHSCTMFLTIVDDFSKCTWTYLLNSKAQVFSILKAFLVYISTQFNAVVRSLELIMA